MSLNSFVVDLVNDMQIGELKVTELPDNLSSFRKYLTRYSQRYSKKFTTKVKDGNLHILRVKFFDIERTINENL